jgi:hypothetical protein
MAFREYFSDRGIVLQCASGEPSMARATRKAHTALALLLLLAAPSVRGATARSVAIPAREVVLDAKTARGAINVRTARNLLTVVEFPESVIRHNCPVCTTDGQEPDTSALFRVEKLGDAYLAITPTDGAGTRLRAADRVSTMFVQLESGTVVMLYLDGVGSAREADARVVLRYPKQAQAHLDQTSLDKSTEEKITRAAIDKFLSAFMGPHECSATGARARNDDIVLRVTEICHFGHQVIVAFSVENRARAPFEVDAVTLNKGEQKMKQGVLSARTIAFDETTRGVEYIVLPDGDSAQGPYRLTVSEKGGKHRVVTLEGTTR